MRKLVGMLAVLAAASTGLSAHAATSTVKGPESLTFSGKIYANLSYIQNKSDGQNVDPTGYGFNVKRGYFGVESTFDSVWSAKMVTDFSYEKAIGNTNVYIKNLFVQRKLNDGMKLRIGVADMPWIPFDEHMYRFRYVENTLIDRTHFGNSADWGVHLLGGNSKVDWQVSLVNGAGYHHLTRSKSMDLAGRIDFKPITGLHIALGAYTGKLGKGTQSTPADNTASRYDALVAYEASNWNAGVEYFHAKDWNNIDTTYGTNSDGYSVFASYGFSPKMAVFGRYDYVKPCTDTTPTCSSNLKNDYYNLGLQYEASKQITFALVYKYSKVDNGTFKTTNGDLGGTTGGKYQEIGIFMQAAF